METSRLAEVDASGCLVALADGTPLSLAPVQLPPATIVSVQGLGGADPVVTTVAAPGSARADLYRLLGQHDLALDHPARVEAEVERWRADPGIDDPSLVDHTHLPYVTIDGPATRDLDQALMVARDGTGHRVRYAIADAAWFVRPKTALFDEALARGATFYLPGLAVPMLPRALSEGLVSLNPTVDRRAMVFEMTLDHAGECVRTEIVRARIHSRAQLTFAQVQALLDGEAGHGIDDPTVAESLRALAEVGQRRIARATARGVVGHRNAEVRVELADHEGMNFVAFAQPRNDVERYSEQLSLLCNVEGAKRLRRDSHRPAVQAIYRTHDAPDPQRLDELQAMITAVADAHGLPPLYRWDAKRQSLAAFLRALPRGRVTEALARQAILVNVRSTFSAEPGPHFGIGADVYARFSAPMREIVGVFVHKELWDLADASSSSASEPDDDATRTAVIERSNAARELQRELTREANRLVLDRLFDRELPRASADRPARTGTVMGIRRGRLYVQLDTPPIDVKVYTDRGDEPSADGATLRIDDHVVRLGDEVAVRLRARDHRGRWLLDLVSDGRP